MTATDYAVVIPTIGRASLPALLAAVAAGPGPLPREVVVVNDRPAQPLAVDVPAPLRDRLRVLAGSGSGPAAARNRGWRATTTPWVVFLDDDVRPDPGWRSALTDDLSTATPTGAVAARIRVPLPIDRAPTDWQRQVRALADAPWITADIAYRREALAAVDGFYEGFTTAYREDTDLAVRVRAQGFDLVRGQRCTAHPVAPATAWVSVRRQRGNADDALLRRRYGWRWRHVTGQPLGRRPAHLLTTLGAVTALLAAIARRPRLAVAAAGLWFVLTADFAARRLRGGPRTPAELGTVTLTSVVIPPVATAWWLRGRWQHRHAARVTLPPAGQAGRAPW